MIAASPYLPNLPEASSLPSKACLIICDLHLLTLFERRGAYLRMENAVELHLEPFFLKLQLSLYHPISQLSETLPGR